MRIHKFQIKTVVAFMLVLCLTMPFFSSAATVVIMAAHTHICYSDEHKDACVDARECCAICINLYETKYRFKNRYCNTTDKFLLTLVPSLVSSFSELTYFCTNATTLISLKVRLNN
ncbi:MAG: hypothetical protein FWC32_04200 [Firmicutes bacterium]|nr:hypothetical protein [Bacillota bacterium]